MIRNLRALLVAALLAFATSPAAAQVVTNHGIAVGRAPAIGLAAIAPAANTKFLVGGGTSADFVAATMSGDCSLVAGVVTCGKLNGVTAPSAGTPGGIVYYSSTSAMASSGALAANQVVVGGGAGAAPSTTGMAIASAGTALTINGDTVLYYPSGFASSSMFVGSGGTSLSHTTALEGYYNTCVGQRCLTNITTGSYNTGVGFEAMENCTTCAYNTGLGEASLIYNVTGLGNTGTGWKAGLGTLGVGLGNYNTFVGYASGISPSSAVGGNTAVGAFSLTDPGFAGTNNAVLGNNAGVALTSADGNTLIGKDAGSAVTTGDNNTVVGPLPLSAGASRTVAIGDGTGVARFVADTTETIAYVGPTPLTLHFPNAADTLVAKDTTDTLTHKTYDTAATGNVFKINGTGISAVTGTGAAVLANTPTLITPVLGAATGTSLQLSGLTASSAVATDGSKNLVSITNTGSGNNVLATSPTIASPTFSGTVAGAGTIPSAVLANTAVTPGSYTFASLTVNAEGQLTAASSATTGQYPGVSTNSAASAGNIGELVVNSAAGGAATVTITIASPAVVTWTGWQATVDGTSQNTNYTGGPVTFTTTGALPTGLTAGTTYYIIPINANTFSVATSVANAFAGTAVNTSGSQSGTQTATNSVNLASATGKDVLGLSLTAGEWDVSGVVTYQGTASTTISYMVSGSGLASAMYGGMGSYIQYGFTSGSTMGAALVQQFNIPTTRYRLSSTSTVFCIATSSFAVSTVTAYGQCRATRVH